MKPKKLLIVDDSLLIVDRLKSLLEGLAGLGRIETAGSYAEALNQLSGAEPPDIMMLDINLPDLNGVGLLRHVRKQYPGIPVVMLSNQGGVFYRQLCLRLGAVHYIDKSTEFELVPTILSSLCSPSS